MTTREFELIVSIIKGLDENGVNNFKKIFNAEFEGKIDFGNNKDNWVDIIRSGDINDLDNADNWGDIIRAEQNENVRMFNEVKESFSHGDYSFAKFFDVMKKENKQISFIDPKVKAAMDFNAKKDQWINDLVDKSSDMYAFDTIAKLINNNNAADLLANDTIKDLYLKLEDKISTSILRSSEYDVDNNKKGFDTLVNVYESVVDNLDNIYEGRFAVGKAKASFYKECENVNNKLRKAKTLSNSDEYKNLLEKFNDLMDGERMNVFNKASMYEMEQRGFDEGEGTLVEQLEEICEMAEKYISHKANDGVKKNAIPKLDAVIDLYEFCQQKLEVVGCKRTRQAEPEQKMPEAKTPQEAEALKKKQEEAALQKQQQERALNIIENNIGKGENGLSTVEKRDKYLEAFKGNFVGKTQYAKLFDIQNGNEINQGTHFDEKAPDDLELDFAKELDDGAVEYAGIDNDGKDNILNWADSEKAGAINNNIDAEISEEKPNSFLKSEDEETMKTNFKSLLKEEGMFTKKTSSYTDSKEKSKDASISINTGISSNKG